MLIALLVTSFCLTSCYHVYYAPNTANAPLLSQKGETKINALYANGGDSEFQGGEFQFAHAVNKNFGVMTNVFFAGKSETVSDYLTNATHIEKGNGSYIEFAGGYFKNFDERKRWIGELYGGIGFGSVKNDYGFGDHSKVGLSKGFIQPAVGYKAPNFEIAFVPKVSFINWKVRENNINSQENISVKDEMKAIDGKKNFVAFEPALLLRGGGKGFKLQLGLSFSNYKPTDAFYSEGLIETLNGSIGISIDLKPVKK